MKRAERKAIAAALRSAAHTLAGTVQLPESGPSSRDEAQSLLDALSNAEKKLLNHLAGEQDQPVLYGRGTESYLDLIKKSPTHSRETTELGPVARDMVGAGWLKMFGYPDGTGYFYVMTEAAQKTLSVLHEVQVSGAMAPPRLQPKTKAEAIAIIDSLSADERMLVEFLVQHQNGSIWGGPKSANITMTKTVPKGKRSVKEERNRLPMGAVANKLVKTNWLRFANMNDAVGVGSLPEGYYYITQDAGKTLMRSGLYPGYSW